MRNKKRAALVDQEMSKLRGRLDRIPTWSREEADAAREDGFVFDPPAKMGADVRRAANVRLRALGFTRGDRRRARQRIAIFQAAERRRIEAEAETAE